MRLLIALALPCLLGVAVGCDYPSAESNIASVYRPAFLGHPVTCNAEPFVDTMPVPTELGSLLDCLGWQEWTDERDLQLDVVRYGTIVVAQPLERLEVKHVPSSQPYSARGVEVRTERTLKGQAPIGTYRVTVAVGRGSDFGRPSRGLLKSGFNNDNENQHRGGRTKMADGHDRGLVFIPSESVDDPIFLGCLGGHFAKPDAFRPKLLVDYEMLTHLIAWRPVESLKDVSFGEPLLAALVESGGSTVGYFVAEYFGWRTALAMLEAEMRRPRVVSPFEIGLVEGMLRMQTLRRFPHYSAQAWADLDDTALSSKLLDWAILRVPDLPPKDNEWDEDAMTDRQRLVAAWIIDRIHGMAPSLTRTDLSSSDDAIEMAKAIIPTLHASMGVTRGYHADLDAFERLLAGRPPKHEPSPPAWFTNPRPCRAKETVSRTPLATWAREAFGRHAARF